MALEYKFVELSIVTDETIEEAVNAWVARGWLLDGIRFVTTEASRRPQMAFISFTRDTPEDAPTVEGPRGPRRVRIVATRQSIPARPFWQRPPGCRDAAMSRAGSPSAGNRGLGRWPGTRNGAVHAPARDRRACPAAATRGVRRPGEAGRRDRVLVQPQARRGRGHVQARDRAQGSDHLGDGLHVQALHARPAHRVDRQESPSSRRTRCPPARPTSCSSRRCRRWASRSSRRATAGRSSRPGGRRARPSRSSTACPATTIRWSATCCGRRTRRPRRSRPRSIRSAPPPATSSRPATLLIITDYASQVRDMLSLAKQVDIPGGNDGIYTIPVKHADATQLRRRSTRSSARAEPDASAPPPPKILVDDRTNTLIVVSSEAGYQRVKALVDRLDISLDTEGGAAIRVYPLENALAEELAADADNVLRARRPAARGSARPAGSAARRHAGAGRRLGSSLEGQVRVIGDKPTNSLIVMSSGRDFLAMRDVIQRARPAAPPDLHRGADPRGPDRRRSSTSARARTAVCRSRRRRRLVSRRRADADAHSLDSTRLARDR